MKWRRVACSGLTIVAIAFGYLMAWLTQTSTGELTFPWFIAAGGGIGLALVIASEVHEARVRKQTMAEIDRLIDQYHKGDNGKC